MRPAAPARTLVVLHVAEMSGPALSLRDRVAWLAEHGAVEVLVPGSGPAAELYAEFAAVTQLDYLALTLPRGPREAAALARRFRRDVRTFRGQIRRAEPDLVVCATAMLPAVLVAARAERVPSLLHAAEILSAGRSPARRLAGRALVRAAGCAAAGVAACSETVAAQYGGRAAVVPPPIPDAFAGGDGDAFRKRHGIPDGVPLLVCAGSLSAGRGQDVLLAALALLRSAHPSAHLALLGVAFPREVDRAYEQDLRRVAATLGDAVTFCGFEPRIADAYAAADVVVNPARDPEAFGRVACEALVALRPVVSARVGATAQVLRDGETALLVAPDDQAALARAIGALLDDPGSARELAAAGRRDVLERFAPERSLESFKRLVAKATLKPRASAAPGPGVP